MSEHDELSDKYQVLCRRIKALDTDLLRELDSEKQVILEERRADVAKQRDAIGAQLALSGWQRADGQETMTDATQQMMDVRLGSTENTLRGLDNKMDRLIDQVHAIDTRQQLLEDRVADLKKQVDDVRNQVILVRTWNETQLPRTWLLAGGISVLLALVMLILITWRVM